MSNPDDGQLLSWSEMLDRAAGDPDLAGPRGELIEEARARLEKPLIRRVYRYEDLGQHRTWLDGRAKPLDPEMRQVFGLAMSDHGTNGGAAEELTLLSAAFRLTGDEAFSARVIQQLEEMAAWSPLQRPGWTCFAPGNKLPPDGKDGNWLATGTGVRAIGNVMDILPGEVVPAELRDKLCALLEKEVESIVDDWRVKRPWFVRADNPITNQWVLPTEGLVRACLILGTDKHREAYELGTGNLIKALDAHGDRGEFEEGMGYASFTVNSMLNAAHAMAAAGDTRAMDHPFLRRFPTWLIHHLMPGRSSVNAFDCGLSMLPRDHAGMRQLLSQFAALLGEDVARWALYEQFDGPTSDPVGLAAASLPPVSAEAAPAPFAAYERATRVNWRSGWGEDGTGVWVRGGHQTDQHDHEDRGHVSVVFRGHPVLIETGTPAYHHPDIHRLFSTGMGHNVLQIGLAEPFPASERVSKHKGLPDGWQKTRTVAPITVRRLDAKGGEIFVDVTGGYDELLRWHRNVAWSADEVTVEDEVQLTPGREEIIVFRWHLGAQKPASIGGGADGFTIDWPEAALTLRGSEALVVSQEERENSSLERDPSLPPDTYPTHTCVVVRTAAPTDSLTLTTRVLPQAAD